MRSLNMPKCRTPEFLKTVSSHLKLVFHVRMFSYQACFFVVAHACFVNYVIVIWSENSPAVCCGENRISNGFYFFAANYISSQSDFRIFISSVIIFQNGEIRTQQGECGEMGMFAAF
jgi:hypothetical protein